MYVNDCREITPRQISKDEKITFVQIKPLVETSHSNIDASRSSKLENFELESHPSPVYSLMINTASHSHRQLRSADDSGPIDYDDRSNESEDRFDTSEAISPASDSEQNTDEDDRRADQIKSVEDLKGNELFKPGGYPKNGLSKSKLTPKKYYGNLDNVSPGYRKYIETRQFRSRCRCEKIWNCPKLQISVHRCPDEYFMCCF